MSGRFLTDEAAAAIIAIIRRIEPGIDRKNAHDALTQARAIDIGLADAMDCRAFGELVTMATAIASGGPASDSEAAIVELVDALTRMVQVTCPGCGQIFADRRNAIDHITEVVNVEIDEAADLLDDEHERLAFLERWSAGWQTTVETLGLDGLGPEPRGRVLEQVAKQIDIRMAEARAEIRDAVQDGLGLDPQRADELIAAAEALERKPDPCSAVGPGLARGLEDLAEAAKVVSYRPERGPLGAWISAAVDALRDDRSRETRGRHDTAAALDKIAAHLGCVFGYPFSGPDGCAQSYDDSRVAEIVDAASRVPQLRRHAALVEQLANARHGREAPPLLRVDVHGPGDLFGIMWLAAPPRVGDILELDAIGLKGRPACRVTGAVRWLGSARVSVVVTAVEAEDWP